MSNRGNIGIFWYDTEKDNLFGVRMTEPVNNPDVFGTLHRDVWNEEHNKCFNQYGELVEEDSPFRTNDYTLVPRGRVSYENGTYKLYIGSWVHDYPNVIELVLKTFSINSDDLVVAVNEHWEIGHGWSE